MENIRKGYCCAEGAELMMMMEREASALLCITHTTTDDFIIINFGYICKIFDSAGAVFAVLLISFL